MLQLFTTPCFWNFKVEKFCTMSHANRGGGLVSLAPALSVSPYISLMGTLKTTAALWTAPDTPSNCPLTALQREGCPC